MNLKGTARVSADPLVAVIFSAVLLLQHSEDERFGMSVIADR